MGLMDRLFGWMDEPRAVSGPRHTVQAYSTIDLANEVGFTDFMRGGGNIAGASVNRRTVMRNAAVKRSVNLISNVVGMLPCHLLRALDGGKREKATNHPLYSIFSVEANSGQDAFQFRKLMQRWMLIDGDAFALILRSRGAITGLRPLQPSTVTVAQRDDWSVYYKVRNKGGGESIVESADMFHLYGDSDNGYSGISLIDEAADVLGVSLQADRAAARLFKNGAIIRDILQKKDGKLSAEAIERLKTQFEEQYAGADNANRTLVLEDGLEYHGEASNAKDSQHLETRRHQIEEVGRIFGMPRPFLMMDDTSWGSGIEQLGIFFVTNTLAPWLKAWESAITRLLLTPAERRAGYYPRFNERALLRGSMKDQAEFFAKMMGSGGSPQIMEQNEARGLLDLPEHPDGTGLNSGSVNGGADNGATGQD
jgi:HK97 family phage portal protein